MNKYRVYVHYEGCVVFDVDAETEGKAEDVALGLFGEMSDEEIALNLGDAFVEGIEEVRE